MIKLEIRSQTGETLECTPHSVYGQIGLTIADTDGVKIGILLSLEETNFLIEVMSQYLYSIRREKDK